MSFHSWQSFSVSFLHVSLGLPAPRLPSICISHAVLIAPLERSTCPNQRNLLSLKMRSRSSSSSFASNLLDLTMATSSGLILQICLIMALSLRCKSCMFVLVSGQVSRNHLFNFGRRHHEEQFCEIILNLDQWSRRRCILKIFLIWSSGSPFNQRSGTICVILVEGIKRNNSVKLF